MRQVLSGLLMGLSTAAIFLVTKLFPALLANLQPYGTYWLFSAISLAAIPFYTVCLPETRGKSLLEIRQMFLNTTETTLTYSAATRTDAQTNSLERLDCKDTRM